MPRLSIPKERTFAGPALLWKRIAAFFIDIFIVTLVLSFSFRGLLKDALPKDYSFSQIFQMGSSGDFYTNFFPIYFTMSILTLLYFYILEKKMSQTIGKKLMDIYIVSDTGSMKRWQALVRNLMFIPIFPFDLLFIADPILMIFTKTNQRLSERLSKTRVMEKYNY